MSLGTLANGPPPPPPSPLPRIPPNPPRPPRSPGRSSFQGLLSTGGDWVRPPHRPRPHRRARAPSPPQPPAPHKRQPPTTPRHPPTLPHPPPPPPPPNPPPTPPPPPTQTPAPQGERGGSVPVSRVIFLVSRDGARDRGTAQQYESPVAIKFLRLESLGGGGTTWSDGGGEGAWHWGGVHRCGGRTEICRPAPGKSMTSGHASTPRVPTTPPCRPPQKTGDPRYMSPTDPLSKEGESLSRVPTSNFPIRRTGKQNPTPKRAKPPHPHAPTNQPNTPNPPNHQHHPHTNQKQAILAKAAGFTPKKHSADC